MKRKYFEGHLSRLTDELRHMIDGERVLNERLQQIRICANLSQYHDGAEVILSFKKSFSLSGDFSALEKLVLSVCQSCLFLLKCNQWKKYINIFEIF